MNFLKAHAGPHHRGSKWLTFSPMRPWELPMVPACYAVYINGELVYVGQTVDLRNRFNLHRFRHSYGKTIITPWGDVPPDSVIQIKARISEKVGDWAMREVRLIRRLKPKFNDRLKGRKPAGVAA